MHQHTLSIHNLKYYFSTHLHHAHEYKRTNTQINTQKLHLNREITSLPLAEFWEQIHRPREYKIQIIRTEKNNQQLNLHYKRMESKMQFRLVLG